MKKRFLSTGLGLSLLAVLAIMVLLKHKPPAKPPVYLQSPLGAAILSHDAPRVERLLRQGADPNVRYSLSSPRTGAATAPPTSSGLTPLMVAALGSAPNAYWDWAEYQGAEYFPRPSDNTLLEAKRRHALCDNPALVQSLLAHGADPNASDSQEWTPLLCATTNSNVNIARALLDGGADINKASQFKGTALMDAAGGNDLAFVRLLLSRGARINTLDSSGRGALAAACNMPVDTKERQALGMETTPRLYSDSSPDSLAVVHLLLSHGAAVNPAQTGLSPVQPLGQAIRWRNSPLLRLLLQSGANPNAPDAPSKAQLLPLMAVPRVGKPSGQNFAFLLIAYGADVNARSHDGNTALTWAADKGDLPVIRLLLKEGAQVNAVNHAGHTALWFAYNNGNGPLRNLLLAQGADATNSQGVALPAWRAGILL